MKLLLTITIACSLLIAAPAQQRNGLLGKVNKNKPSVFISFVRAGNIEPLKGVDRRYLWFRITNNMRSAIWLEGSSVPKEYGDAALSYAVEDARSGMKLFGDTRCHVCSGKRLPAGKSLVFSLPREHISEGRRFRIDFSFDWENEDDVAFGREVEHSVFFYASKLPGGGR